MFRGREPTETDDTPGRNNTMMRRRSRIAVGDRRQQPRPGKVSPHHYHTFCAGKVTDISRVAGRSFAARAKSVRRAGRRHVREPTRRTS
jgi:hypothetical protein